MSNHDQPIGVMSSSLIAAQGGAGGGSNQTVGIGGGGGGNSANKSSTATIKLPDGASFVKCTLTRDVLNRSTMVVVAYDAGWVEISRVEVSS